MISKWHTFGAIIVNHWAICQSLELKTKLSANAFKLKLKCIRLVANLCILASALRVSCNFNLSFRLQQMAHYLILNLCWLSNFDFDRNFDKYLYIFCYIISRYSPIGQRETFNFFTSGLIFRKRTFGQVQL